MTAQGANHDQLAVLFAMQMEPLAKESVQVNGVTVYLLVLTSGKWLATWLGSNGDVVKIIRTTRESAVEFILPYMRFRAKAYQGVDY